MTCGSEERSRTRCSQDFDLKSTIDDVNSIFSAEELDVGDWNT